MVSVRVESCVSKSCIQCCFGIVFCLVSHDSPRNHVYLSLQEVLPKDVNVWQDHSFLPHQAEAESLKTKQLGDVW